MRFSLALFVVLFACQCARAEQTETTKPNIVLLFIDDWAWNGTPVAMDDALANSRMPALEMPNIERLAKEGMKFRNAYASPQCSPSRVCVQTGQSSPRNGYTRRG
jgi:arylsulfatase A